MFRISATTSFKQNSYSQNLAQNSVPIKIDTPYYFEPQRVSKEELKESKILPDTFSTKFKIATHKIANTLSVYPTKGFSGDKNTNFYELLTMGMFPYITGGLTFIALFNGVTKYVSPQKLDKAQRYGLGMGLGVIFYGIAKELSKKLISIPVALKTGIKLDEPYRKVVDLIPKSPSENGYRQNSKTQSVEQSKQDDKAIEFHTTFESVDFPRMDLYYKTGKDENRNEYFDYIAEKNGFGENLPDSDQEVKPFIKEVVTKARTAQTLSSYLWASVGVGLGVQEAWSNLIGDHRPKSVKEYIRTFKEDFKEAAKQFYNGGVDGAINKTARYAGRAVLGLALLTTVFGIINSVSNPYMKNCKKDNAEIFKNPNKVQED